MTNPIEWFRYQLRASGDGLLWAYAQIQPTLHEQVPPEPDYLGTWQPARHVWHITEYERCVVLPSMKQWLTNADVSAEDWPDDDAAWSAVKDRTMDSLAQAFRAIREEQIQLLDKLDGVDWNLPRDTLWGKQPLMMVVTKTFQHTYEHGDTLMRMGLWWR